MSDKAVLRRAARDLVLDHLTHDDLDASGTDDVKLACVYDELMRGTLGAPPPVPDPMSDPKVAAAAREAELDFLGRTIARSYVQGMVSGTQKLAAGLESLRTAVMGMTPEERMERDRAQRQMELELSPQELSLALGAEGARGSQRVGLREMEEAQAAGQEHRTLGLRELSQRQELANQLRRLQLGDQYARREREEALSQALHGERQVPGALKHMLAGGVLARLAKPALETAIKSPETLRLLKGLPPIRTGAALGLGTYLARKALESPHPGSRAVQRLERERYTPASLVSDVSP